MLWPRHLVGTVATCCALFAAAPAAATVRYVDTAGDDAGFANDCTAPGVDACLTIQNAMAHSAAGDEVIVAAGTYDVTNTVFLGNTVYLHGDLGGARPLIRGGGGLLQIAQPGTTVRHLAFEQTGSGFGNGTTVWTDVGNLLVDDIDVSIDSVGGPVNASAFGSYVQLPATGTVTLSNSTLTANSSSGWPTVWAGAGQLIVRNTAISRRGTATNVAALGAGNGGSNPYPTIDAQNVTIETTEQPCITLYGDSGAGSLIRDVTATQDAPGVGNALYPCVVIDRTSTFQDVTVNAPESQISGAPVGGMGASVPAVAIGTFNLSSSANVVLKNLTVNTRGIGVGASTVSGLQIRGGRFTGRFAGIQLFGTTGVVSDAFTTGTDTNSYGIVANNGSSIKLRNLTAIGTGTRQAIYATDGGTDITIKNTIARGTGAGEDLGVENTATMTVSYSNYVDSAVISGGGSVADLGGHQTGDPLFTNPVLFDYHVLAGSPVVDAGTTDTDLGATDIDGEPRNQGAAPDIGADERPAPPPPPPPPPPGDGGGGSTPPTETTPTTTPTSTETQNVPGPVVTISAAAVKVTKTGVANIRIGCPATAAGACTGTLALQTAAPVSIAAKKKIVKLGSRSFKLAAGKQAFVGVKLNKQGLQLLKKLKRLRVKALANVQDANGAARITQRLLSLKLR